MTRSLATLDRMEDSLNTAGNQVPPSPLLEARAVHVYYGSSHVLQGVDFQISTRLTSWVAIDDQVQEGLKERGVDVRMPHEMPYGTSVDGLGLRLGMLPSLSTGSRSVASPPARPAG